MTIIPDCFVKIKGQDNQIQNSFLAISFSNCKEFELNSLQLQYVNLGGLNLLPFLTAIFMPTTVPFCDLQEWTGQCEGPNSSQIFRESSE